MNAELLELSYGKPRKGVNFALWADLLGEVALCYHLDTAQRLASFLAQLGHESGRLYYVREIWGPTAQQRRYEPVTSLSKVLGNTEPGDGKRFMGHGPIQVTGRRNHAQMRDKLRKRFPDLAVPDFEAHPEALCVPLWSALSAGEFWDSRGLNQFADIGDQRSIRRRVNGGYYGYAECVSLYATCFAACLLCGV